MDSQTAFRWNPVASRVVRTRCKKHKSFLSLLHSSPAGAAKHRRLFAKHLRGRSSVSLHSLLFCCDAVLKQTVRNVVFVNGEIRFLNQVSKSL